MREEVNEIARRIIKDTRDKHFRYQDIAIYIEMKHMPIYLNLFCHNMIFLIILILKIDDTSSYNGNDTFFIRSYPK